CGFASLSKSKQLIINELKPYRKSENPFFAKIVRAPVYDVKQAKKNKLKKLEKTDFLISDMVLAR
ncbi:MAG: hypothetical protein AAGK47_03135, partial [Bacteroidota bacterium]